MAFGVNISGRGRWGLLQCYPFSICNLDAYDTFCNSSMCTLMIYEFYICICTLFKNYFKKDLKIIAVASLNEEEDQSSII